MAATPRSEFIWLAIFNYINYHAFEKRASEHQCNILLKSGGESNKGLVSLLSRKHPTLPSRGQGSHWNAEGSFKKSLWLFKLGTSSASPGLHLLCCAPHCGTARTGWCATSLNWEQQEWSRTSQRDEDVHSVQVTLSSEEAQGGYCSNLSLRRSHETS